MTGFTAFKVKRVFTTLIDRSGMLGINVAVEEDFPGAKNFKVYVWSEKDYIITNAHLFNFISSFAYLTDDITYSVGNYYKDSTDDDSVVAYILY